MSEVVRALRLLKRAWLDYQQARRKCKAYDLMAKANRIYPGVVQEFGFNCIAAYEAHKAIASGEHEVKHD